MLDAGGIQWDYWGGIKVGADIVDVQWKPMDEILDGFPHGAQARYAWRERAELGDTARHALPGIGKNIDA